MYKVLIYGDSLSEGLILEDFDTTIETRRGYTTEDFLNEEKKDIGLSMLLSEDQYNYLVIVMGTNDERYNFWQIDESVSNIVTLLENIDQSKTKVIISTIMSDAWNKKLDKLKLDKCKYLHEYLSNNLLDSDGVHLNVTGKKEFSNKITESIKLLT